MSHEWTLYLRGPDRERVGQIDEFGRFEAYAKFNDVGTWQLDMDSRAPLAGYLSQPGYGIELVRDNTDTVFSGNLTKPARSKAESTYMLSAVGKDDNWELTKRLAHPSPTEFLPPYSITAYDVRSGTASTVLREYVDVNLGPGAIPPRQVSGLALEDDPGVGSTVTGRARWQNLLTLLQELALSGGGLGFRTYQSGSGLVFSVYQPEDKSDTVMFSNELGNLGDYRYEIEAPEANYLFIGGQGEGTARTILEGSDSAEMIRWGRIESFEDRRDTASTDELGQEITKTLAEKANKYALEFTPVSTKSLRYLDDYSLGDKALVTVEDENVTEVIRQVKISLSVDAGAEVTPSIDSPGQSFVLKLYRRVQELESKLKDLERR